jgi:hypothetical protein
MRHNTLPSLTSALDGVGDQHQVPANLPPRGADSHGIGDGWTQGPVWTVAENLAPTGINISNP